MSCQDYYYYANTVVNELNRQMLIVMLLIEDVGSRLAVVATCSLFSNSVSIILSAHHLYAHNCLSVNHDHGLKTIVGKIVGKTGQKRRWEARRKVQSIEHLKLV